MVYFYEILYRNVLYLFDICLYPMNLLYRNILVDKKFSKKMI